MTLPLPSLETLSKLPNPRVSVFSLAEWGNYGTYLRGWLWGFKDTLGKLLAYGLLNT